MKSNYPKGIISIILSALGFAGMAFFVKLSGDVPILQKAVFRNMVTLVYSFVLIAHAHVGLGLSPKHRLPMLGRCLFGTIGFLANFLAIEHLNLGDASILQKMAPFFAIVMSIFILNEKPNKLAIICIFTALIGAAFVVKPTSGLVSVPALIGLLGGFCGGTAYTFVRRLGTDGVNGNVIIFYFSISSVLALLPFVLLNFQPMTLQQTVLLLLAGLCAVVGQVFVTKAYSYAPAKEISVFDYTQVIFAALLGIIFLSEVPDLYSIIGYVIIIATALIKWNFDRKEQKTA